MDRNHAMIAKHYQISDPSAVSPMIVLGRRYAEDYWRGTDRHPLTTERRLVRLASNSREYLDALYGYRTRLREISNDDALIEQLIEQGRQQRQRCSCHCHS